MIDGQLAAVKDQHRMLVTAAGRPYSLDNATVERVVRVFGETADGPVAVRRAAAPMGQHSFTETQRSEVERLVAQGTSCATFVGEVLSLATRLKGQTIEALLAKSDLKLGIEGLLGGEEGLGRR